LTGSSKEQLVSLREVKKTQIHDYFDTIRKQIQTFSENQMVVDGLRDMNVAFHNYREEQKLDEGAIAKQKRELTTYLHR
jgi:methyl-accepting chemotaxis protein